MTVAESSVAVPAVPLNVIAPEVEVLPAAGAVRLMTGGVESTTLTASDWPSECSASFVDASTSSNGNV